jgi:hypothetical protein
VLLLALGVAINVPWLINPVLAAWTTASVYRFAARTTTEATARGATLLFALSPFVLLMSATQMNHVGTLALVMFGLAALAEWTTTADPRRIRRTAMFIGLGLGGAATIRPYDAALVGLVIGIFQLTVARHSALRFKSLAWQIGAGVILLSIVLWANWQTTGSPLLFGYDAVNGASHRPGFHVDPAGVDFTPIVGLHHISSYLLRLNISLFLGPIPGLVLVVAALFLMTHGDRWDYLMLGIIGALVVGYGSYWAESFMVAAPCFLYVGIPAFVLFVAKLPEALRARLRSPDLRRAALFLLPASMVVTWATPSRAATYVGAWPTIATIRGPHPERQIDLGKAIAKAGLTDALVFVHESWHGRLAARLRALGAPDLTAESMAGELDACALQRALDAEDFLPPPGSRTRINRVVLKALSAGAAQKVPGLSFSSSLKLVHGLIPPDCLPQLLADRDNTASLEKFIPFVHWGPDGRLGGPVVFARDFGHRNVLLLDRFGDRAWYIYRPRKDGDDTSPLFVPYRGGDRAAEP